MRVGKDGVVERDLPKRRPSSSSSAVVEGTEDDEDEDPMRGLVAFKLFAWPSTPDSSNERAESLRPRQPVGGAASRLSRGNGKLSPSKLPPDNSFLAEDKLRDGLLSLPRPVSHRNDQEDLEQQTEHEQHLSDAGLVPAGWDREAAAEAGAAAGAVERGSPSSSAGGVASRGSEEGVRRRGRDKTRTSRGNLIMFPALVRCLIGRRR